MRLPPGECRLLTVAIALAVMAILASTNVWAGTVYATAQVDSNDLSFYQPAATTAAPS